MLFPEGVPLCKRIFDLLVSSVGLLLLSPLLLAIAVINWIVNGRPVFFSQKRPGYKEIPFNIYKFRTMLDAYDKYEKLLPDAKRITPLGRFLRSTSLDELPELVNILRGEMSWIGPRPLLQQYLDIYTPDQSRRHEVLPGITGWAQINGRNILTWEDKFLFDVWYVDHWSFWLDIKILLITIKKVITREGINQPGHATSEEFRGSQTSSNDLNN